MSDHNPLTLKLNLREKIAYGMGDVGSNLMLSIGTLYLLKFYTDELGMPAYYGGIIFLVAKFLPRLPICSPDFYSIRGKILGLKESSGRLFYTQRFRRR